VADWLRVSSAKAWSRVDGDFYPYGVGEFRLWITESNCDANNSPIELGSGAFFVTLPESVVIAKTNFDILKLSLVLEALIQIHIAVVRVHFAVEV
jgi:hypothetical protein